MATSNKVFVSPGVYTSERDLSFVAQSVGVTTLGIVGETIKGPAFEPIFITSFDEFQAVFGGTLPEKFVNTQIPKYEAAYIAKSYLQQSNQLFVTRVLGLSGYDAGPSWSITSVANVDGSTVEMYNADGTVFSFTATTGGNITYPDLSYLSFGGDLNNQFSLPNGSSSTIQLQLNTFINSVVNNNSLSATSAYVFGTLDEITYSNYFDTRNNTNVYSVPDLSSSGDTFSSRNNDAWYYSQFTPTGSTGGYSGYSFGVYISTMGLDSPGVYTGSTRVKNSYYAGTAYTEYNDVVNNAPQLANLGKHSSLLDVSHIFFDAIVGVVGVCASIDVAI